MRTGVLKIVKIIELTAETVVTTAMVGEMAETNVVIAVSQIVHATRMVDVTYVRTTVGRVAMDGKDQREATFDGMTGGTEECEIVATVVTAAEITEAAEMTDLVEPLSEASATVVSLSATQGIVLPET
mmetsp:Transcript_49780/g.132003  ORF Transcript_49780/g.132003 Transcript_49780/m.132003 type:complete len:128 (-) Transcript_49780:607-990(-)